MCPPELTICCHSDTHEPVVQQSHSLPPAPALPSGHSQHPPQSVLHFIKYILEAEAALFVLLAAQPGVGVGDLDGELGRPLHDYFPVLGRHVVSNLCAVRPVWNTEYIRLSSHSSQGKAKCFRAIPLAAAGCSRKQKCHNTGAEPHHHQARPSQPEAGAQHSETLLLFLW